MAQTLTLKDGRELTIKRATPADSAAMIEYLKIIGDETDNLTFASNEINITVEEEEKKIEAMEKNPDGLMIMAMVDGVLAGNLTFAAGGRARTRHAGEFGISVRKDFWGLGIGKSMMEELFSWARTREIRKINLRVRTDNYSAINLYLKTGFEMEGRIRRDFLIDGEFFDSYTMGKVLD